MSPGTSVDGYIIQRTPTLSDAQIRGLAELLIDCVEGGASVSFMHPLPLAKAVDFWRGVAAAVAEDKRALLVARDATGVAGTVQLILEQPENQPHRADLSKMLVHRRARRRGLGAALLRAAEHLAQEYGKSLLVLDTASGDAERLYAKLGWQRCGVIPGYALWPRGGLCDTTYFYRTLPAAKRNHGAPDGRRGRQSAPGCGGAGASGGTAAASSSWMPISSIKNCSRSLPCKGRCTISPPVCNTTCCPKPAPITASPRFKRTVNSALKGLKLRDRS